MGSSKKEVQASTALTHQRLVKTTPKPNATKNSSGELVGPALLLLLLLLLAADVDAVGAAEVGDGIDMVTGCSFFAFRLNGGRAQD